MESNVTEMNFLTGSTLSVDWYDIVSTQVSATFAMDETNQTAITNVTSTITMKSVPRNVRTFVNPAVQNLYVWCTYIVPFLAILFNGLSIAVFLQRRFSKATVSTYLIALAVCDTLAISMIFYTSFLRLGWWPLTDLGCQISVYLTAVGRMCSIWLVVFFTTERFISVKYVFKKSEIITPFRVRASIVCLVIIMLIEQSFIWVWVEKIPPAFCFNADRRIQRLYFLTLLVLNRVFNFMIPLVLVSVMNSVIIHTVRQSGHFQGKATSAKEHNDRRLTVMLVMVSTINFMLLIPETTAKIMEVIEWFHPKWLTSFGLLADVISYLSHCCNFFFYVISGKQFRSDFIEMVCCVKCRGRKGCKKQSAIAESSNSTKFKQQTMSTNTSMSTVSCQDISLNVDK